jgi:hypothetical protein
MNNTKNVITYRSVKYKRIINRYRVIFAKTKDILVDILELY